MPDLITGRFTEPVLWNLTMGSAIASSLAPLWERAQPILQRAQPIFERTSVSVTVIVAIMSALILHQIVYVSFPSSLETSSC